MVEFDQSNGSQNIDHHGPLIQWSMLKVIAFPMGKNVTSSITSYVPFFGKNLLYLLHEKSSHKKFTFLIFDIFSSLA